MKKIILFSAVACSVAFYSCKKDSKTDTTPVTETPTVVIDPEALSAAVKLPNATSTTGDLPTSSSADAPVLVTDGYDMRTYYAVNNRYVVIYPRSTTGFIAGYYVKINGANNYFKISFPAKGAKKANKMPHNLREDGDNSDSAIIIKLPAGLKGDTFSVKYAAYDSTNRVSNTLTAIVSIIASADSTDNNLLVGTWKYNSHRYNDNDWNEPFSYKIDTSLVSYSCVEGKLQPCDGGCEDYPYQVTGYTANDIIFSTNNLYTEQYARIYNTLDVESSSCSNLVYDKEGYDDKYYGGYAYDAKSKVLTVIYDGNGTTDDGDASNITIYNYTVTELSATRLVYLQKRYDSDRTAARGYDSDVSANYYEYLKK
jgi:hypothetical protein